MSTVVEYRPSTKKITVAAVRQALLEVVREHPGARTPRAVDGQPVRYVEHDEPHGLVALVMTRLGFSTGVLKALDQEHPLGELLECGVRVAESRHPALRKLDPRARQLLGFVQGGQDAGLAWERILADAFSPRRWFPGRDRLRRPWLLVPAA